MNRRLFLTATLSALLCAANVSADDKSDADVQKKLSEIAALGPGVNNIKKDEKGRIKSCVIVGQARISTVLGKAKGLETARQRASLAAKAEFVKWLKEKVTVYEKTDDQTLTLLEGKEEGDKDSLKESGKAIESTSKKMESVAEGLVRGMQNIHTEVSDKDKTYTVVMGWDAETANATKKVKKDLDSDEAKNGDKENGQEKPKKDKDKKSDKKIEDKKSTSKDAKKFID